MARSLEALVTQSVLDRLLATEDWPASRSHSVRFLKDCLKRDMEWLLNTRQSPIDGIHRFRDASRSVIHYGLMDTSALSLSSTNDHLRLQKAVHDCIASYEPRLKDVKVVIEQEDMKRRQLRFHIEAQIRLDPTPEEISFDTVLDLTSGQYTVS